jgi:hypothetical protein
MKLSVVIPSYFDPLLHKTIDSLLENSQLGDQLEIIPVLDGYWGEKPIIDDPRVKVIHLGKNRGMRGAINAGISIARGEFFMRLDEHVKFGKGYDKILTDTCKENEVMTARRFFLNPEKWEIMEDKGYVDYEKLTIQNVDVGVRKFHGKPWKERTEKRKNIIVDESEALQGSMWIANREFWLKTCGELQTFGYGSLIQDSVEVTMKYWQAGGRLMVNKNTYFAHKHSSFPRTHNSGSKENPAHCNEGYTYSLQQWEEYFLNVLRPKWDEKYANEKD